MDEERQSFPSEIKQFKNFAEGRKEFRESTQEYKPKGLQTYILLGLLTLVPDEVKRSDILSNPVRMKAVDWLIHYQMRFNDRLDFAGAGRTGIEDFVSESKIKEAEAREGMEKSLDVLNEPELRDIIHTYIQETETVETYVRMHRDTLSFDESERYRNIVNAVSSCAVSAVIFGAERFRDRLVPIQGEVSWNSIYEKYKWMMGDSPRNSLERALMIMQNLGMAVQVDDDRTGMDIDKLLNIPSLGLVALREHHNDMDSTVEFLDEVKDAYVDKSIDLGMGILPAKGFSGMFTLLMNIGEEALRKAKSDNDSALNRMAKRFYSKRGLSRENAYIEGRLDIKPEQV